MHTRTPTHRSSDYGTLRELELYRPLSPQAKGAEERAAAEWYAKLANECAMRQIGVCIRVCVWVRACACVCVRVCVLRFACVCVANDRAARQIGVCIRVCV